MNTARQDAEWLAANRRTDPETCPINRPAHYTQGKVETIDVIEDAIASAPDAAAAFNQGQVLKYLSGRLWHKGNAAQDAKKALWYLRRLVDHLDNLEKWNAGFDYEEIKLDANYKPYIPFEFDEWSSQEDDEFEAMGEKFAGNYSGPLYAPHPELDLAPSEFEYTVDFDR